MSREGHVGRHHEGSVGMDALMRYYEAKGDEERAVMYIEESYRQALDALERLEAENDKLRKLCGAMMRFVLPSGDRYTLKEHMAIVDDFYDRCKEFGIEVND